MSYNKVAIHINIINIQHTHIIHITHFTHFIHISFHYISHILHTYAHYTHYTFSYTVYKYVIRSIMYRLILAAVSACSCIFIVQGTCGDILTKEKLNRPGCNKKMYTMLEGYI